MIQAFEVNKAAKSKTASRIARTTWGYRQSQEGGTKGERKVMVKKTKDMDVKMFVFWLWLWLLLLLLLLLLLFFKKTSHTCLYVLYMFSGKFQIMIRWIICYKFIAWLWYRLLHSKRNGCTSNQYSRPRNLKPIRELNRDITNPFKNKKAKAMNFRFKRTYCYIQDISR